MSSAHHACLRRIVADHRPVLSGVDMTWPETLPRKIKFVSGHSITRRSTSEPPFGKGADVTCLLHPYFLRLDAMSPGELIGLGAYTRLHTSFTRAHLGVQSNTVLSRRDCSTPRASRQSNRKFSVVFPLYRFSIYVCSS